MSRKIESLASTGNEQRPYYDTVIVTFGVCVKFCFKLGKKTTESHQMSQQAYGDAAIDLTQTFEWFSKFRKGRDSVKDDHRTGRPKTSINNNQVELVREKLMSDRQLTAGELSGELAISFRSVQTILTDNQGTGRIAAKFVPRFLFVEQKLNRVQVCFLTVLKVIPILFQRSLQVMKSWVYGYDPETKH